MRTSRILAVALIVAGVSALQVAKAQRTTPSQQAERDPKPGTRRRELQRHDISAPGCEVIQVRVDFDPGYVAPRHTHPGEEMIYVIEGTLEYVIGGKPATVKAGDVLFVPAGVVHSARNVGNQNGAELATYVVEKGKPLITLVE
jgi:quercetin dioxygenase-like cupin family protein